MSDCCSVEEQCLFAAGVAFEAAELAFPAFPTGSYSHSHGIEWAVEAGSISLIARALLIGWKQIDLLFRQAFREERRASTLALHMQ